MLFWGIAAVLTAIVTLALLRPVARVRSAEAATPERHDIEVYRDQLAELDRDLAGGLIEPAQAEVARAEISRRLLAAARKSETAEAAKKDAAGGRLRRAAMIAVAVFMPLTAIVAYLELGRPDLPQLPLSARLQAEPENTDIAMLIARAERHLAENPEDGRGWSVLGPIYLRTGRFEDAAGAFRKSIALLGPSPERLANLGEALYSAAGGIVTEEAGLAFQTARELDPQDPRPQFFLAVALAQSGNRDEARAAFNTMIDNAPEGAPWLSAVRSQIAALGAAGLGTAPLAGATPLDGAGAAPPRDPSAADIAAAREMSPEDRQAMIQSMIDGLESRLADNPDNIEGWVRLVRSHAVTGDRIKAQAALDRAFAAFPAGGAKNQALIGLAADLGLAASASLGGVPVAPTEPSADTATTPPASVQTPFILEGASPQSAVPDPAASGQTALAGPSQADIAAAAEMPAEDRMAMIRNMVASLDSKLTDDPDNIEGWLRLVRSYAVLGERDAAASALSRAGQAFPDGSDGGRALAELAAQLGLTQTTDMP
ncbi:c-type cytochrome biogenesis protein CcmI [uncultured Hoeflea sp.]|uniref:c-type cytochrome biogenesis protein CcmI n=1 Tax=uncultured Hoeflea sp. TaxID=538666 RepID=UPI0026247152|nr:c-type cytochrome biogenesis protein CcmI [uncultured Hoeflea sp.]